MTNSDFALAAWRSFTRFLLPTFYFLLLIGCASPNEWKHELRSGKLSSDEHKPLIKGAKDSDLLRALENGEPVDFEDLTGVVKP